MTWLCRLVVVWLGVGLVGCASVSSVDLGNRPEKLDLAALPARRGLIVGSLARKDWKSRDSSYAFELHVRNRATREVGRIHMEGNRWSGDFSYDFQSDAGAGMLFALAIPAGEYEIYWTSITIHGRRYGPNGDVEVSVPFEVLAGKTVYLGQVLHIPDTWAEMHAEGRTRPTGGHFELSSPWERDSRLLQSAHPNVDWSNVTMSPLVAEGPLNHRLFRNAGR